MVMTFVVWKPKSTWAVRTIFSTLVVLFLLLAISEWCAATQYLDSSKNIKKAAGAVGLICGGSAFYTALAEVS